MELISVLCSAYMLQRKELAFFQNDTFFSACYERLKTLPNMLMPLLMVFLPSVVAYYFFNALQGLWFGLFELIFLLLLLAYSLGRDQLPVRQDYFRVVSQGDQQAAYHYAEKITDVHSFENFNEINQAIESIFLWQRIDRWFAVIFWFVLLGPAGALAYRLLQLLAQRDKNLKELQDLSHWLPARVVIFSFAVVANFDAVIKRWSNNLENADTSKFSWRSMCSALGLEFDISDHAEIERREALIQSLLKRSLVFWLLIFSLVVVLT